MKAIHLFFLLISFCKSVDLFAACLNRSDRKGFACAVGVFCAFGCYFAISLWWFENSLVFGEEEKGSAMEVALIITF